MHQTRTIVHIVNFKPRAQRSMDLFLMKLAEEMQQRLWRTVFVFAAEPAQEFAANLQNKGIPYLIAEFPLSLAGAIRLTRQLRPHRPQMMHTCYMSPFNVNLWWLKLGCGMRIWISSDRSSGRASAKKGIRRLLAQCRGALTGVVLDRVIAVSHFVAQRAIEASYLPAEKVTVSHNGVDTYHFVPRNVERASEAPLRIVFAGQMIPEKGVMLLLEVIRQIQDRYHCELLLAGTGSQAEELREFCRRYDMPQVRFLGQVDDTPALFSCADVVVVPSQWEEAFGFVVAEAMACGACVLAADSGGIPEIIGHEMKAEMTFRRGDVEDLKIKLCRLLESKVERRRLGEMARERAVRNFSIDGMVARYTRVIEELACPDSLSMTCLPLQVEEINEPVIGS